MPPGHCTPPPCNPYLSRSPRRNPLALLLWVQTMWTHIVLAPTMVHRPDVSKVRVMAPNCVPHICIRYSLPVAMELSTLSRHLSNFGARQTTLLQFYRKASPLFVRILRLAINGGHKENLSDLKVSDKITGDAVAKVNIPSHLRYSRSFFITT
ncbi:hypothetical protein V6N11_000641 [Hibiscus sabdariffa]|uniref:Uncharacterized protein n=1 Tax=Hibiscus sabdariffa TaxID=183260 RepID=A0ABR2NE85_9ROSI